MRNATANTNEGNETMTYGIKRTESGHVMTETQGFMATMFLGVSGYNTKQWKTRSGAQREASRWSMPTEVFTIIDNVCNW